MNAGNLGAFVDHGRGVREERSQAWPGLTDAYFKPFYSNMGWINSISGGGPLGGSLYQVNMTVWRTDALLPGEVPSFHLRIGASKHYEQNFFVRNGDNFEVRLDRIP